MTINSPRRKLLDFVLVAGKKIMRRELFTILLLNWKQSFPTPPRSTNSYKLIHANKRQCMLHWKLVLIKDLLRNKIDDYMKINTFIAIYCLIHFV